MQINTRKQIFFPYQFRPNSLDININDFKVDGETSNELIDKTNRRINLSNKDFNNIKIAIEIKYDINTLYSVIPKNEKTDPPCDAFVILRCDETKLRRALKLTRNSDNIWSGNIELQKKELKNKVEFLSFIVRTIDRNEIKDKFAKNYGERLLSSNNWTIQIDEFSSFPGNFLDIEWSDFKILLILPYPKIQICFFIWNLEIVLNCT